MIARLLLGVAGSMIVASLDGWEVRAQEPAASQPEWYVRVEYRSEGRQARCERSQHLVATYRLVEARPTNGTVWLSDAGSSRLEGRDVQWSVSSRFQFATWDEVRPPLPIPRGTPRGTLGVLHLPVITVHEMDGKRLVGTGPSISLAVSANYADAKSLRYRDGKEPAPDELELMVDIQAAAADTAPELDEAQAEAKAMAMARQALAGAFDPNRGLDLMMLTGAFEELKGSGVQGSREWSKELAHSDCGNIPFTHRFTWGFSLEAPTVTIVTPHAVDEQVFRDGRLVIEAAAQVQPDRYASEAVWDVGEIPGSTLEIAPQTGRQVRITFTNLPASNNAFGEKTITVRVRGVEDQVRIRVFFSKDAKDNPDGTVPNWYYYWRQGVVDGLGRFRYEPTIGAYYMPETGDLVVGDSAATALGGAPGIVLQGGRAGCRPQPLKLPATEGVFSVARAVAHELEHERLHRLTHSMEDRDKDRVPDAVELASVYCLDPTNVDTHGVAPSDPSSGDGEIMAMAVELQSGRLAHPGRDWASPGAQSKAKK